MELDTSVQIGSEKLIPEYGFPSCKIFTQILLADLDEENVIRDASFKNLSQIYGIYCCSPKHEYFYLTTAENQVGLVLFLFD